MIAPIVLWLLQDFLQVLIMGICTVPDVFMMSLIMYAVLAQPHKDRQIVFIWIAFAGDDFTATAAYSWFELRGKDIINSVYDSFGNRK